MQVLRKASHVRPRPVEVRPDMVVKAFFRGCRVGILIRVGGRWIYHGLVPILGESRTMQIMQKTS